jgi:hypothetical protein
VIRYSDAEVVHRHLVGRAQAREAFDRIQADAARTHDSLEIWKAQAVAMEAKAERERLKVAELTEETERVTKAATALVVLWDEWDQAGSREVRDDIVERIEAAEHVLRAALDRGSSSPVPEVVHLRDHVQEEA